MSGLIVAGLLLGAGTAGADSNAVYRYRDSAGVDHFVNHLELVPKGVTAKRVDLEEDDLNPDLAREMTESAQRAATEAKEAAKEAAKAAAAEAAQAAAAKDGGVEEPLAPPAEVPPEAHLVLIWAIAFSVVFGILWLSKGLLLVRSPSLAAAFQPIRWGCGAAALLSWIVLATLSRGWLVEHFAPLHAVKQAQISVDKINRQQRDTERELEKNQ